MSRKNPLWMEFKEEKFDTDSILVRTNIVKPPIDILSLVKYLGIKIFVLKEGLHYRSVVKNTKAPTEASIWINTSLSRQAQNFELARSLGHIFLHPYDRQFSTPITSKKERDPKQIEIEAERFAERLLMPNFFVSRYSRAFNNTEKLIKGLTVIFDVPTNIMEKRLLDIHNLQNL